MRNHLLSDPMGWSAASVATPARFWCMAVAMAALQFAPVWIASTGGWSNAIAMAAGVAGYQFMFLFALRKLYLHLARPADSSGG